MNFLPPETLPYDGGFGYGDIAVNADGTLLASVNSTQNCVYIYSLRDPTVPPLIVNTAGAHGRLKFPTSVCFVRRSGRDTLLIIDWGKDCVVEVTAGGGVFLRAIEVKKFGHPFGIAYCDKSDVIAVSLHVGHAVVLLQYESGAQKSEFTIGSRPGDESGSDGLLFHPMRVAFTADGDYIVVADYYNHRVSKFSAVSGAFIAHVATNAVHGITYPDAVLPCEDGSVVMGRDNHLVRLWPDTVMVDSNPILKMDSHLVSLCYCFDDIIVRGYNGKVLVLRDAWARSSRGAWLCALIV